MTTTTMTAIDTGPARAPRTPRAEKQTPAQQQVQLTPRDGVNTNQQLATGVGASLAPVNQEKKPRKAFTRTPYITEQTNKDVQQILVVLNANFINKTFRLAEVMEKLPQSLLDSWENPALDLNRYIKRVMGIPEVGKADNTGTRGRRPNLYFYSGTYVQKRVAGKKDETPAPTDGKKKGRGKGKKNKDQNVPAQSARDTGAPAGGNVPVDQPPSNVVALAPATQHQPVASFEEKHNVNGVDYYLGGESNFVRRTTNDPVAKHMVAAVFDLNTNAFHRVNDDLVRLPKKERAKK